MENGTGKRTDVSRPFTSAIPAQRKKQRIILEEIVKAFEPDREYTEKEVNLIIADYFDDFCTIRRDCIAEKLMTRENGIYKRC